ncbi:NADH dehydrogenase subunit K (chloroplast) [Marchantia polymorpha subsp. ruderalis]|nr:NADH dehydrogenase subunit K [Marchantia polymorpha subsp. ruderalis]YP_009646817.1 NADH dehydrogenase subunit K [Marchantia polymorpha]AXJ93219.1 NADH dehydrogenase subunit K [Marchantia polymorpha subsp. ruderalis]AZU95201.1 NADH dehydrogenase subunit K [Marchantia polymorpha]QBE89589.1 NADH dehydrogenase subunit K [Marchantia polymorpha subsp. ruderalis]BBD75082.1 NADH dehydrogenase subunit K [Marchantia polymorpha subsp. ruderalis]BDD77265.1 NADH dehydrogenase subunit K [Marchantia pol
MVLNFKFFTCENNLEDNSTTILQNSIESSFINKTLTNSIILTTFNDFSNWARLSSLWPLLYGTSCCFIEFASLIGSRFDFDRYGLVPRSSPRQADLIITAGTVTMKMAPSLVRLYEQMPEPKYVIAMGACTITGGMFSTDSYTTVRGVDKLIPVDIYLPGCPPKPEAIIDAIIKLRKKIAQEIYEEKKILKKGTRFLTLSHQFNFLSNLDNPKLTPSNQFFQSKKTYKVLLETALTLKEKQNLEI